jgi:hypothetical protein
MVVISDVGMNEMISCLRECTRRVTLLMGGYDAPSHPLKLLKGAVNVYVRKLTKEVRRGTSECSVDSTRHKRKTDEYGSLITKVHVLWAADSSSRFNG